MMITEQYRRGKLFRTRQGEMVFQNSSPSFGVMVGRCDGAIGDQAARRSGAGSSKVLVAGYGETRRRNAAATRLKSSGRVAHR